MDNPLFHAFKRAIANAGGQTPIAEALGVTQSAVSYQLNTRRRCPAEWVPTVSRLGGVPRAELRPDLFGEEAAA